MGERDLLKVPYVEHGVGVNMSDEAGFIVFVLPTIVVFLFS